MISYPVNTKMGSKKRTNKCNWSYILINKFPTILKKILLSLFQIVNVKINVCNTVVFSNQLPFKSTWLKSSSRWYGQNVINRSVNLLCFFLFYLAQLRTKSFQYCLYTLIFFTTALIYFILDVDDTFSVHDLLYFA